MVRPVPGTGAAVHRAMGHGPCIGHVAPEAARGARLALVEEEDPVHLNADTGELDRHVDDEELERGRARREPPER